MPKVPLVETSKFILWVNDHLSISQARFEKLIAKGCVIVGARSTEKAMKLFRRANYDAVITDLRRSEQGRKNINAGIELTQQIRRINADVPILIYTGKLDISTKKLAEDSGSTLITTNPKIFESALKHYGLV